MSIDDEIVYHGNFTDKLNGKILNVTNNEPNKFAFTPYISNLTEDFIEIQFNFNDTSNLTINGQATYQIEVLQPSVLRSR